MIMRLWSMRLRGVASSHHRGLVASLTNMSACYSVRSTNKGGVRNDVAHHRLLGVAPLYSYAGKVLSINGNTSIGYQLHNIQRRSMMMAATGEEIVVEVPAMGDSITEGTVVQWLKEEGDTVAEDEVVVVLETDKVSIDVRAPQDGIVCGKLAQEGETVEVGVPLMKMKAGEIGEGGGETRTAPPKIEPPTSTPPTKTESVSASPPPPKQEAKVSPPVPPPSAGEKVVLPSPQPVAAGVRTESRVKMTRMRIRIAERLKSAQNKAAMLTTFQETDMTNLMALRKANKDSFEKKHGVKLGFMSCFVKATTDALKEIPAVNGYIDDATKEIVLRNFIDISVAVSSPSGLVVPVLRNVEDMGFADIEKAISNYAAKAKAGSLALEDMAGGTFTISNGGVFGSLMGTPIINPPQSAILGMHATKMRPVVIDGQVVARPMMYLALTYDHRMVDGREAVTFLKSIAEKRRIVGNGSIKVPRGCRSVFENY